MKAVKLTWRMALQLSTIVCRWYKKQTSVMHSRRKLVCVWVFIATRSPSIDFLFLEVSHLVFPFSLLFFFCLSVSFFLPRFSLRNALNVLIFAHANTRVSQQQRLNSSADPMQTDHTTHWHLDSLQPKWLFTLTVKSPCKGPELNCWPASLLRG